MAALASLSGLLFAAGLGALTASSRELVLGWVALAFVPYALVLAGAVRGLDARALAWLALACQAPAILAPPSFSDDAFRYLWDARVLAHGLDPFAFAPDDAALRALRDVDWLRVNHREIPTIYPVGAQLVFFLGHLAGPTSPLLGLKLVLMLALHLAARLAASGARESRERALAAVLFQPLLFLETAVDGHVDVVVGLVLVGAWVARGRRSAGSGVLAGVLVGAAAGVKLIGLLLVPMAAPASLGRRRWVGAAVAVAVALALSLPVLLAGRGSARDGGALEYARRWEGNAGAYSVTEHLLTSLAAPGADGWGRIHAPALRWLAGTPLHPHAQLPERKRPADPTVLYPRELGRWLGRALVAALALGFAFRARAGESPRAVRDTLLVTLLLSPQLHPWYLAWALPLEIAGGGWAASVLSAAVLVAHAGEAVPPWLSGLEHALAWAALGLDRGPKRSKMLDIAPGSR